MRPPRIIAVFVALALPTAFAACGDDGSDTPEASGPTTTVGPTTTAGPTTTVPSTGTGTIVVGERTFTFDAKPCRIDAAPQATVDANGKGTTTDGRPFTIVVKRSPSDTTIVETVQLAVTAGESAISTNLVSLPAGAANSKIKVTGKQATASLDFSATGALTSGPGTLTLTCK